MRKCLTHLTTKTRDHVENTAWKHPRDELSELQHRQWCLLSRLKNQVVTSGKNGSNLLPTHEQRVVPRHDSANDAQRLTKNK